MKTTTITILMMLTACRAVHAQSMPSSQSIATAEEHKVTVCMEHGPSQVWSAQAMASKIFANIGVTIVWQDARNCPRGAIFITLRYQTPATFKPGALAYALLFEGVHIQVFQDRVSRSCPPDVVPVVLAHVFAHEITDILQGIDRHSEYGLMKAHWDRVDFFSMRHTLRLTDDDAELIFRGMEARSRARTLAFNRIPQPVQAP